jgi:hypothetical protein
METKETDSLFRGNWQATIERPTFGAYQFLPTPLPQQPRKQALEPEVTKENNDSFNTYSIKERMRGEFASK